MLTRCLSYVFFCPQTVLEGRVRYWLPAAPAYVIDPDAAVPGAWRTERSCYHNPFRGVNRSVAAAFPVVVPVAAEGDPGVGSGVLVELTMGEEG